MPGPAPKDPKKLARRNLRSTAAVVSAAPAERAELPSSYRTETKQWWRIIWSSPISDEWVDADVPGLLALAALVDAFWAAPPQDRAKQHAEVRMASREFGLSPFSRRQLQWEVRRAEAAKPPPARPAPRKSSAVLSVLGGGKGS